MCFNKFENASAHKRAAKEFSEQYYMRKIMLMRLPVDQILCQGKRSWGDENDSCMHFGICDCDVLHEIFAIEKNEKQNKKRKCKIDVYLS